MQFDFDNIYIGKSQFFPVTYSTFFFSFKRNETKFYSLTSLPSSQQDGGGGVAIVFKYELCFGSIYNTFLIQ